MEPGSELKQPIPSVSAAFSLCGICLYFAACSLAAFHGDAKHCDVCLTYVDMSAAVDWNYFIEGKFSRIISAMQFTYVS